MKIFHGLYTKEELKESPYSNWWWSSHGAIFMVEFKNGTMFPNLHLSAFWWLTPLSLYSISRYCRNDTKLFVVCRCSHRSVLYNRSPQSGNHLRVHVIFLLLRIRWSGSKSKSHWTFLSNGIDFCQSGYIFFIGNSIFPLIQELLTNFWKTSLKVA